MKKMHISQRVLRVISIVMCLVFCGVLLPVGPSDAASTQSDINALRAKIDAIQKEKEDIQKKIDSISDSKNKALDEKNSYESQLGVLEQEIASRDELITQYSSLIDETIAGIEGKEEEIDAKFGEFLERLRINYEDGFVNYLVLVLESNSFTEYLMNTERTADILEYDRMVMNNMEKEKSSLGEQKKQLEEAKAALEEEKKKLDENKADLDKKRKNLDSYIQQLENDEEKQKELQLAAIEADKELNDKLEKALAALAEKNVPQHPVNKGDMIWPLPTAYGTITDKYGPRTLFGQYDFHLGVDIPAPAGTPVYASQAGVVEYAEKHYSYGNFIVINHGGGVTTLYAHNSALHVSVGQTVAQGDTIASVGRTGTATGNHCHFEVRVNGKTQNPLDYVNQP
ncbi:MAG: peptidoglycan DD-metalloendopeptidase family protein [Clostridiales bacterium]|nr:peptidoglycan DD-metalloendopeptidase family protein [Clostridiales bacterium]